ncbi:helix-turn-helix domain-containing protein [uncultured Parvibaculum sp.]|uniref:winged helix-turn-helix transcriptional regulator n=1 Tax=uncultured Parvibaculum sp. TaxID=291828 RepID=UPI0030D871B9|tara:strand:- start:4563 stop:5069 length:507 start_codon:yes stop_codon:yes gene_type:complete
MTEKNKKYMPPVRRSPVAAADCNLSRSFELIGDRWTLMILRSALYGIRRFDDFQADLDIPRTVLSNRLAGLVESGIMKRRTYREAGQRARAEYPLTEMGQALALPFMAMTQWGDKYLGEKKLPLTLRSKSAGGKIAVAYVDGKGRRVTASDVEAVVDPAFRQPDLRSD